MTTSKLTQAEFAAVQDKIDDMFRASRTGTPERAAAETASDAWEAAIALPDATFAQREARFAAIAEAAKVVS